MKKLFITLLFLIIFSLSVSGANALDDAKTRSVSDKPSFGTTSGKTIERLAKTPAFTNLKGRADLEIQRRVEALQRLINRINSFKKLTDAQKSEITAQIQKQIDSLNSLKTKISSDSDIDSLKSDIKSIVSDYRVYTFYIEYINTMAAAERIDTTLLNITAVYDKLVLRVDAMEASGKDTARLKSMLADILVKINDAKRLNTEAKALISTLSISGYPDNKATLLDARTKLKSAYEDLRLAFTQTKQIISQLSLSTNKTERATQSAKSSFSDK